MKPYKVIPYIFLFVVVLGSCKKEDDNNPTGPDTPASPNFPAETARAIFLTSIERDASGFGFSNLTVFEPNGSIRWKRAGRGGVDYNMTYSNGIIFSSEPNSTGSLSNFYAYDINTGMDVWAKIATNEFYHFPVVRNDTLFCSTMFATASTGNIAAFNARTGALYWRKNLIYPYYPVNLLLDGNTLFFIVATSPVDSKIISFNITSKSVNWESPSLGINLASSVSNIVVSPTRVFVKTGTKLLMAFDRTNGTTVWSKPGIPYDQPVLYNSIVYAVSRSDAYYPAPDTVYGLYAFDAISGNKIWNWKKNIVYSNSNPVISGDVIFYAGMKKDNSSSPETGFICAFNVLTGTQLWTTNTGVEYDQLVNFPVAVGSKVYVFRYSSGASGSYPKLVIYDGYSGQPGNSIQLTGESFGKLFIVGSSDKVYTPS